MKNIDHNLSKNVCLKMSTGGVTFYIQWLTDYNGQVRVKYIVQYCTCKDWFVVVTVEDMPTLQLTCHLGCFRYIHTVCYGCCNRL